MMVRVIRIRFKLLGMKENQKETSSSGSKKLEHQLAPPVRFKSLPKIHLLLSVTHFFFINTPTSVSIQQTPIIVP
jgi:hypothetical protein